MPLPGRPNDATVWADSVRSVGSTPPWTIPNSAWSGRSSAVLAATARASQAWVRSSAVRTTSSLEGSGGHTSSTICTSAPSWVCNRTATSGVNRIRSPS